MTTDSSFRAPLSECEAWYVDYPFVLQSQIEAIRQMLPTGDNLKGTEVGLGSGMFAAALGIKEGVDPPTNLGASATHKGIEVKEGDAEHLPYQDLNLDFALMVFCNRFFNDLHIAFQETYRVLKKDGVLVIGFIDRNSAIGKDYEQCSTRNLFYRQTNFFSVEKVIFELNLAGYGYFSFLQTLFEPLDLIKNFEPAKNGFGEGSFIVIQAKKAV